MLIQVGRHTWRSEHTHCLYSSLLNVATKSVNRMAHPPTRCPPYVLQQTHCGGCSEACRGFRSMASRNWHTGMSCDIGYELRTSAWVVIMSSRPYKSVATRPSSTAIVGRTCWHESNSKLVHCTQPSGPTAIAQFHAHYYGGIFTYTNTTTAFKKQKQTTAFQTRGIVLLLPSLVLCLYRVIKLNVLIRK